MVLFVNSVHYLMQTTLRRSWKDLKHALTKTSHVNVPGIRQFAANMKQVCKLFWFTEIGIAITLAINTTLEFFCKNDDCSPLTLKTAGGGLIQSIRQENACHFSQDHTMVTKFLEFINKHPKYKVVKYFFHYLDRFSRNSAETEPRLWFFGIKNHKIDFFCFRFLIIKKILPIVVNLKHIFELF